MREITSTLDKELNIGLSPSLSLYTQVPCLHNCYNVIPTDRGLVGREDVYKLTEDTFLEDFPHTFSFILGRFKLVFTKTALYSINEAGDIILVDKISLDDAPHLADFLDYVLISTPKKQWVLTKQSLSRYLQASFATCCNFKGQLIVGNCKLPNGPEKIRDTITNTTEVGGKNVVAWSRIGAVDWQYTLGNEVGWAIMPWNGEVLRVLPFADIVMVYGTNGVARLTPVDTPTTTFGVHHFGTVGILNRNCVAGDNISQVFLGTDYNLYQVLQQRQLSEDGRAPKLLGYRDYMKQLVNPIISFDESLRHWWIGDADRCFILTETGLGEASITPTSLSRIDGSLYGYCAVHGDDVAYVETSPLSLGGRGIKTLMTVESDCMATSSLQGVISWRSQTDDNFRVRPPIPLDPRGAFFPVTAGTEFKVGLGTSNFRKFFLSKLWLHHKNTDKTFARGGMNVGRPSE